jgi:hypothetical protein
MVEIRLGMRLPPAEMIVANYDKGFAKTSQRSAFRDRPVAPSLKPAPAGGALRRGPRLSNSHAFAIGAQLSVLRRRQHIGAGI